MARKNTRRDFAVIGLQGFGENLALSLQDLGHSTLAIDRSRDVVQRLADNIKDIAALDPTDPEALTAAGVDAFETVIIALGEDLAQTVLVALALREIGVTHIVAEAQTDRDKRALLRLGISQVVTPDLESARAVANQLAGIEQFRMYAELRGVRIASWTYPASATPVPLGELQAATLPNLMVLLAAGDDIIPNPPADTVIEPGTTLVLFGRNEVFPMLTDTKGPGSG